MAHKIAHEILAPLNVMMNHILLLINIFLVLDFMGMKILTIIIIIHY